MNAYHVTSHIYIIHSNGQKCNLLEMFSTPFVFLKGEGG